MTIQTIDTGTAIRPSKGLIFFMACACGLIVANIYYAQPLVGLIAPAIHLDTAAAGLIVTLTQLGYCAGLLLLVPLGDLVENRRLILLTLGCAIVALGIAAGAQSATQFFTASFLIGLSSVCVQMLIPVAAHLSPEAIRGRVVGNVMGGLLTGIMLARPIASMVADSFGWRMVFGASAALMALLSFVLWCVLPYRKPSASHAYHELIGSMWSLLRETPVLRRRAAYQAALFGAFSLYWTAVPLVLAGPQFGLSQRGIALFSLAGVAGALAAPLAGRLADRGKTYAATGAAIVIVATAIVAAWIGASGSLALLLAAGITLDFGVQANGVLGQRTIFALASHTRSRLNGLYIALFFAGGAVGSSIASLSYAHGGWASVSAVGIAFPIAALLFYFTEPRTTKIS